MKSLFTSALLLLALLLPVTATAHEFKSGGVNHTIVGYFYDVNHDGEVSIADVNVLIDIMLGGDSGDDEFFLTDINSIIDIIQGGNVQPEPDFVDLGLPSGTLWATRNVGASSPEDYGDYFAWGEIEPKEVYTWDTYKWNSSDVSGQFYLTKYCYESQYGDRDGKTMLDPVDDAACVHYPGGRMPTLEQIWELRHSCTWQWTQSNGVNGLLVTGPNGKTVFLPAGGYRWEDSLQSVNSYGCYWSLSLGVSPAAYSMEFNSDGWQRDATPLRSYGFLVRAVYESPK